MTIRTAVSDTTIAQTHRVIGMVNLALALVCLAMPAIRSYVGEGMALLLTVCLLAGAAVMFRLAHCFDPYPRGAVATLGHTIRQHGVRGLATA